MACQATCQPKPKCAEELKLTVTWDHVACGETLVDIFSFVCFQRGHPVLLLFPFFLLFFLLFFFLGGGHVLIVRDIEGLAKPHIPF